MTQLKKPYTMCCQARDRHEIRWPVLRRNHIGSLWW